MVRRAGTYNFRWDNRSSSLFFAATTELLGVEHEQSPQQATGCCWLYEQGGESTDARGFIAGGQIRTLQSERSTMTDYAVGPAEGENTAEAAVATHGSDRAPIGRARRVPRGSTRRNVVCMPTDLVGAAGMAAAAGRIVASAGLQLHVH